jgi:hypothetical protein
MLGDVVEEAGAVREDGVDGVACGAQATRKTPGNGRDEPTVRKQITAHAMLGKPPFSSKDVR